MGTPDFRPTHIAPGGGLATWSAPDGSLPSAPLDPLLPVQLVQRIGDWGRIVCANGWSAWVDGRLLISLPQDPPAAGRPPAGVEDPQPLLARTGQVLERYRRMVEELAAGRVEGERFRQGTAGLRAGVVVDGEAVWVYDAEQDRWAYCDGTRLVTYEAPEEPSQERTPPPPPAADGDPLTATRPAYPPTRGGDG
ncbi:hypothetical protein AB0M28_08900 [Streptomyces sp. NPDC051940]|uniref:hypothetical protein n=1 Tax=Streptomyces sp. NPDC051940 TaxID=3155675 RepID=UPI00343CD3B8